MALDFSKVSAPKGSVQDDPQASVPRRTPSRSAPTADVSRRWHGRSCPPPPPGSGWTAFLDWACEGAFDHSPEDAALAMRLWTGKDDEAEEARPPSP